MFFRIISLSSPYTLRYIDDCSCIIRDWDTNYRGLLALICQGQVLAVTQLAEVTPVKHGQTNAFRWKFTEFQRIEPPVECGRYTDGDRYEGSTGPQPKMLNAHAQHVLESLLSVEPPEDEDTPVLTPISALNGDYAPLETPDEGDQLSLF